MTVGPPAVLPLVLERTPTGQLRVTSPALPGWACSSVNLTALGACLDSAWTELAIASYAAARGVAYDAAHLADAAADPDADGWMRAPDGGWTSPAGLRYGPDATQARRREEILRGEGPPPTRRVTTPDGRPIWRLSHNPAHWTPLPGGDWRSPAGRRYRADSLIVSRVIGLRRAAGLPVEAPAGDD